MQRLIDRVAFISGAGSGIGRACAQRFAREGAAVIIAELDEERGASCARDIEAAGGAALFVATDVTREDSVGAALDLAVARFGKISFDLWNHHIDRFLVSSRQRIIMHHEVKVINLFSANQVVIALVDIQLLQLFDLCSEVAKSSEF